MKFQKKIKFILLLIIIPILFSSWAKSENKEVIKVKEIIEKIKNNKNTTTQEISVSENEINSYLDYRIRKENIKRLKKIKLKILNKNVIEGKATIQLENVNGSKIFNIYFRGKIMIKNRYAKFDFEKLFLEEQPIPVNFLEFIIDYLSKLEGYEPLSIFSWYELPYGIKNIKTEKGKIIIYY
ncbi:hypothetical protein NLB65_01620 [Candidatus Aminicenantes bacterium AC-335-B20]|jgi:hypothetical protein|nr:hypothetical protein [SCandidatus Aminicenantes bacterium Aminicenantia_JdfR_composite]MCP2596334.1 hypothetical protein [Candidatus Aminicenantes bacterium AC-335-G13]MCP2599140.1 hypothetical protein [Candidatus Aminicenantes bacterium AC-335-B20]MCP2605425.1 hypothetical protein [Candidatus Aminicenantes bacterium AC-335-O07]MCP2617809.1 hypothetical protein [Candidatus Aminicenantes bacterium AC-335-A11]